MKFISMVSLLVTLLFIQSCVEHNAPKKLSVVQSIDDQPLPQAASEVSEDGLPYADLPELLEQNDFTILPEEEVHEIFKNLESDSEARNQIAGGKCAIRRSYIQNLLKKDSISSGRLLIDCPLNNGHMKLIDQVTGRRYTFSNFHDVNIVEVPNNFHVLDVQFESGPMTLSEYLAQVEASQKLKPLKEQSSEDKGYCYWSIE